MIVSGLQEVFREPRWSLRWKRKLLSVSLEGSVGSLQGTARSRNTICPEESELTDHRIIVPSGHREKACRPATN
jgi:hypothetical protein